MENPKPIQANNPALRKANLYNEFVLWSAMPPVERVKLGIESQKDFASYYGLEESTLSRWKQRPDYEERMDKILRMWGIDKTPDVIQGIYRAAIKGNPASQLLWLQYFKKFNPKQEIEHTNKTKVEIGPGDVRRLIDALPEPLKSEHHANLRKLIDDVAACRHSQFIEDAVWTEQPTLTVPAETDNHAPDLPEPKASPIPKSYPGSLRADMVGEVSAHHYQSAAGWRQEQTIRNGRV